MPWPTTTDFSEAIQSPAICFRGNPELAGAEVALYEGTGRRGMPIVASGQFACVYQVRRGNQDIAIRCFSREVQDQQRRYEWLNQYLETALPDSFVRFHYLQQGIMVRGQWYPIVQMDWAAGQPLDRFVQKNLDNPEALAEVARRWRGAVGSLRGLGIAHNDLQHGNILVQEDNRINFVDYDSIFLPRFQGQPSPEMGHKNYQHPHRTPENYNELIDGFPALVIYLSLLAIKTDPSLWDKFHNDDNMLLTQRDYSDPKGSACMHTLIQSREEQVRALTTRLADFCTAPTDQVPDLENVLRSAPAPSTTRPVQTIPPAVPGTSPKLNAAGGYRSMLHTQEVPANLPPTNPGQPAPSTPITCRRCGQENTPELIYCVNPACIAMLSEATKSCVACNKTIPAGAAHCIWCGQRQGNNQQAHNPTGHRQDPGYLV